MAREAPQAITIPTMSCTINVIADGSIYALAGIEKNTIPRQKNKENINALPIFFIFSSFLQLLFILIHRVLYGPRFL